MTSKKDLDVVQEEDVTRKQEMDDWQSSSKESVNIRCGWGFGWV